MAMSLRNTVVSVVIAGFGSALLAEDGAVPKKLTPDTFETIKSRVDLTPKDLAWQQVRWRDGFFEGLLDAQAEDKPIFYWIYEGDPRAHC